MPNTSTNAFDDKYRVSNPDWVDGDATKFRFYVKEIKLKSGDSIEPQRAGVTAIVGSNNAGKSTILRELNDALSENPPGHLKLSVDEVTWSSRTDVADLFAWLSSTATFVQSTPQDPYEGFIRLGTNSGAPDEVSHRWVTSQLGLANLASFLCFYGNAEGRLQLGNAVQRRQETGDPPGHPIHALEDSKILRETISGISASVFHQPLTLDQLGSNVCLRVGAIDVEVPRINNITAEYRNAMAALRKLEDQGDGMRSFFGQLLPIIASTYPVVILDEPEAFLHPPQARALGLELGKLAKERNVQVIVATHDKNLLTGLLEADGDVSVVRVSRDEAGQANAHQLDAVGLRELWSDPVLKYSNVLDALFHRVVVLAEAEGDCGYLAAALDSPTRSSDTIPSSELLFVHTSGKAGLSKVAAALRAVRVPVIVAPDFDIINNKDNLQRLMESLGAAWGEEEDKLWNIATNSIRTKKSPVTIDTVIRTINASFKDRFLEDFTSDVKKELDGYARTNGSPWAEAKRYGVASFEKEERVALLALLAKMEACGLVPVQVGELESLAPSVVAKKGNGWLPTALEQNAQSNELTQQHMDRIMAAAEDLLSEKTHPAV
ncbi:AAA family ATPase [Arthrobacter alpinus]|uniref:AAA family ATPase n=1 Tax=Arthrobacter alpinus TaxID=656366 RepID=UPI00164937E1|nr:AAA family ATPase [Arthrobacter alpinus]